jgi:hypothetical protein
MVKSRITGSLEALDVAVPPGRVRELGLVRTGPLQRVEHGDVGLARDKPEDKEATKLVKNEAA